MLRILVVLLFTAVLSVLHQIAEAKPARNVVPTPGEKMFPTGQADIDARKKMLDAKKNKRRGGPPNKRDRPSMLGKGKAAKKDSAKKDKKDTRREKSSFKDRFADKFEKIAEKSGLRGEELDTLKTEMREHSAKRAELAQKRREILQKYKDAKDSEEAKAELAEVEKSLKEVSSKHREVMKAAKKGRDKKPDRKGIKDRRAPRDRNADHLDSRRDEMQRRRSERTKERLEKLWEEAQKGEFTQDELAAIRSEIDEFIASEAELLKQISPPTPMGKDSKKDPAQKEELFAKRREAAEKMKTLGERRKKLEARIRKKEL